MSEGNAGENHLATPVKDPEGAVVNQTVHDTAGMCQWFGNTLWCRLNDPARFRAIILKLIHSRLEEGSGADIIVCLRAQPEKRRFRHSVPWQTGMSAPLSQDHSAWSNGA